jgi:hypothetical protein
LTRVVAGHGLAHLEGGRKGGREGAREGAREGGREGGKGKLVGGWTEGRGRDLQAGKLVPVRIE